MGLDLDDVGDVCGTDHDVQAPLGEGRWLGCHSWDFLEEPEHVEIDNLRQNCLSTWILG